MRLFGRFKKPQAPVLPPLMFSPEELDKLAEIVDDTTTSVIIETDPKLERYPSFATPQIGASLFTAPLPVRQIPVILADGKPTDLLPQIPTLDSFGPRDDSVSSYATLGLSDSDYRQIALDVLTSKLRSQ